MSYSKDLLDEIFSKGEPIPNEDPKLYRKDKFGNEIHRYDYGKQTTYGWEVDHSKPQSIGGTGHLNNLQPLQWEENRSKSDNYPYSKN